LAAPQILQALFRPGSATPSTKLFVRAMLSFMAFESESPLDLLWKEYGRVFADFDDLSLARWLAQTLGQLEGKAWRMSHPLVGAYRLAAQAGNERQIWHKRLATPPAAYTQSACCRAPFLPLLTRDVRESGLICQHCNETLVPFEEIPADVRVEIESWAQQYEPVHAVAHWDDRQRRGAGNFDAAYENAARAAEKLLVHAGRELAPKLLTHYAAAVWEDQDECLEVRPEDAQI
jgi:hypothetical protein